VTQWHNACIIRDVATGGCGGVNSPNCETHAKIQVNFDKIQVKTLTFSGKICVIKSLFLWNDNHFCEIQLNFLGGKCGKDDEDGDDHDDDDDDNDDTKGDDKIFEELGEASDKRMFRIKRRAQEEPVTIFRLLGLGLGFGLRLGLGLE
jgi:hypothetical protein